MKRFRYISFIWLVIALGLGTTTRAATSRNAHTQETLAPGSITSNLISEGFDTESFPPVGWVETIVSDPGADPDWSRASTEGEVTAYTGLGMARFNSRMAGEGASARLETPVFAGSEDMTLSFWMLHDYTNSYDSDYIQPQISTDGGTNYTSLSALILRYDAACGNPCWKQHTFDLDEYAGESNLKVGLLAVSSGGNHMFIDDFLIRVPGPDFQNSTISASEIAVTEDLITYNLLLTNNGDENASSTTLTDSLPSGVDYLTGSLTCSAGICNYDSGSRTVSWNGSIDLGETITITFEARVTATDCGSLITNEAVINDPGLGYPFILSAETMLVSERPILYESFENTAFPPAGWTETIESSPSYGADWSRAAWGYFPVTTPHAGRAMARFNASSVSMGGSARLASPEIQVEPGLSFRFWLLHQAGMLDSNELLQVQISADGGSYTNIGDPIDRYDPSCKTPCWRLHTVDLKNYVGQTAKIGFLAAGRQGFDFYLDDITYAPLGFPCSAIVPNPPTQTSGACPGNAITYDLEFWNDTSAVETVTFATDAAWPVSVTPSSAALQPGAAQMLNIAVSVPWTAEHGTEEAAIVTAHAGLSGVQGVGHLDVTAYLIEGYHETTVPHTIRPSQGASVVYYDDHLYRIGGIGLGTFLDLDIYSISTNTWYSGAALPEGRILIDCVEIDGFIYCAGGLPETMDRVSNTMDIYHPGTNTWNPGPDMPGGLAGYAGTVLNGEYYLIGGSDSGSLPVNQVYIYNPSSGWRTGPPLQSARIYPAAGTIDGKIYVAGGIGLPGSEDSVLNSVEVFDPQTGKWSTAAPMPGGGTARSADAVLDNRYLIVAGGQEYYVGSEQYSNRVLVYDTVNKTWTSQPELGSPILFAEGDSDGSTMWVGSGIKLDETGEIVQQGFLYRSINCARYPPTLVINPPALEIQLTPGTKRVIPVSFENTGDLSLEWELEEKSPLNWLRVDPISGLIDSKKVSSVNLTFDAAGLDIGVYPGVLQVTSNDPIHPLIEVPVTLQVDYYEVYLPTIAR